MARTEVWEERWRLVGPLGQGGQGTTRLVVSKVGPPTEGVLKTLRKGQSALARARMNREAAALDDLFAAGVKVPKVLDSNTADHANVQIPLFFVMERIPGDMLSKMVESRGKLPIEQAVRFILSIAETVAAAHKVGVLHRDLKPDNIIVRDSGKNDLVIVDYGISFNEMDDDDGLTDTTEQFGNRFLFLPEMKTPGGDRRDFRSDICAVCALLYFCLTGHKPGLLTDSNNRPIHRNPGCSVREELGDDPRCQQVESLLDRGLSVDVQSRFQTWEELMPRLHRLLSGSGPESEKMTAQQVADAIRTELLRTDQRARIQTYKERCQETWKQANDFLRRTIPSIGPPFRLQVHGVDVKIGRAQAAPNDAASSTFAFQVELTSHSTVSLVHYVIVATTAEFVLRRRIEVLGPTRPGRSPTIRSRNSGKVIWESAWEDVAWFDPTVWIDTKSLESQIDSDIAEGIRRVASPYMPQEEKQ